MINGKSRPVLKLGFGDLVLCLVLLLSACTAPKTSPVDPQALGLDQQQRLSEVYARQEPLGGALTLSEAMARSVAYNMDYRLALLETQLALERADLTRYDMLPKVVAKAGYTIRNSSLHVRTLDETSNTLSSFERRGDADNLTGKLSLSWNIIDYGLASIRGQQKADEARVMNERRRKVVQGIIQDVRVAYWRSVASERMTGNIGAVMLRLNEALRESELVEIQRVLPPLEALEYQKRIYLILQTLEGMRRSLVTVKSDLRRLINLQPGQNFRVLIPHDMDLSSLENRFQDVNRLEREALGNRPEMRSQKYGERITVAETERELRKMLPNLEINTDAVFNNSRYVQDNFWVGLGSAVSWNLMDLFSRGERLKVRERAQDIERLRTLALAAAVVAQVNISFEDFKQSLREFRNTEKIYQVNRRIAEQVGSVASRQTIPPLEQIEAETNSLISQLNLDLAFADIQASYGQVLVSVGNDPLPESLVSTDLSQLVSVFESYNKNFGVRYDLPIYLLYYNI